MKLLLDELSKLFNMVYLYLQKENVKKIAFEGKNDYYPMVLRKDINFNNPQFMQCPKYAIGSLDDDIQGLKDVLSGKHEPWELDLQRIGAILTTIGGLLDENISFPPNKKCEQELSLNELRLLFKIIPIFLKNKEQIFLKKQGCSEFFFEGTDDYYFKISHKDINFYDEKFVACPPFTLGSLTENIIDLKKILAGEANMNGKALEKLGAVLVAIGEI